MEKQVLGHIDCPACGYAKGMRITLDKNGDPFGFSVGCCGQQMRIGGNAARVALFKQRYPWAAGPVTDTGPKDAPEPVKTPVTVTVPEQTPTPPPKRKATFVDALAALGVTS
jgi:hypothetical protein